jgi:diguanylate cyclase (GGDEF)-like protein
MVRPLAVPMIATSATSLLLAGLFGAIFVRIRRSSGARLGYYLLYALLAGVNAVFLGAFAVLVNSSGDLTRLNLSNRVVIVAAMFTVVLAIHFFSSFYEYPPPVDLRWIYAGNVVFSILCAVPSRMFLGWEPFPTSRFYTGLEYGPLFQVCGAYILAISVYGLLVLLLISRRAERRVGPDTRPGFALIGSCTIWLLTGIADDATAIQLVDLPPATWLGSFFITVAIAWVLVRHVESLYDERRALYDQLIHDHLTGAYSRSYFELRAAEIVRRVGRDPDAAFEACVVLVDVDDFKQINDRYGHASGDEVLRAVARVVMASVRDTDIVARFGGDEFALLLERVTSDQNAREIVERIRCAVAALRFPTVRTGLHVTCSLGLARLSHGPPTLTADALLMAADGALYAAKARGKNTAAMAGPQHWSDPEQNALEP